MMSIVNVLLTNEVSISEHSDYEGDEIMLK